MVDVEYIRKQHYIEGWSIREISRRLGYARQTIRKALASSSPPRYERKKAVSSPVMDPFREVIMSWLEADLRAPRKQRHTAKRIYDRLVGEYGFEGGESTLRRYVARLKEASAEAFFLLGGDLGEQAQVDWGRAKVILAGKETEVCLFCMRLKSSRVPFVWAFRTEKLEAFLEGHRLAFEWFGGVPKDLLYDNPKTAVVKILSGPEREEHQVFSSLRAHYLFNSHFCAPGKGNEKGSVENLVGYVRRNAMVPLPKVADLDTLNQKLLSWCEKEQQRSSEWNQEQGALRPLPIEAFRCSITRMVKVNKLSLITHDRSRYSVPTKYVGQTLRMEVSAEHIEVWHQSSRVAQHPRSYESGATRLDLNHYLKALAQKPRAVVNAQVVRQLPKVYQQFREHLCSENVHGYRNFCQLLLLHQEFHPEQVQMVLERAWELGMTYYPAIRQLLLNQSAPPPPDPVLVPALLQDHRIGTPNFSCYDALLEVAASDH